MYFEQEGFIFHPTKLSMNSKLEFSIPFEEVTIPVKGAKLNAVYFKIPNPKGVIFFVHGNAGNLLDQEVPAKFYTALGFDFFTFDFRGYGKSSGEITSEEQFYDDVQSSYNFIKGNYSEKDIYVIGYSVGTASAAMITQRNNPGKLVLIAPYFSLVDMTIRDYKIVPTFLLEYKFETHRFLEKIKKPVLLIHGKIDEVLPFESSVMLSKLLDKDDEFFPIKNQGHNDFEGNVLFSNKIREFLNY
jgi:pimeloyl-ACP methyl ester carboxylesterase